MEHETFESEFLGAHERGDKRDSFSDEFQGAPGARDSFTSEFRGPPEPTFADDRPSGTFDHGRKARRAIMGVVVALAVVGGGAWAIWYWSEPIGAWLSGLGGGGEQPEATPEVEPTPPPTPEPPAEPPVEKVFGIKGPPDGGDSGPVPEPMPVDEPTTAEADSSGPTPPPTPPPTPTPGPASIETLTTHVQGKVSGASVSSHLGVVDTALRDCWTKSAGNLGNIELELHFSIKWNGKAHGVSVTGGDDALQHCVKDALPATGWPQPSDGGEATIVRRWKLGTAE